MVKHGKRRGRLFVPRIKEALGAGALAANDLISGVFTGVLDRDYWLSSIDVLVTRHDFTAGEGPIIFGVAHSDYTAAEIEEWLEATTSWSSRDKVENEQASRKCRMIGMLNDPGAIGEFNDGKEIRIKCGWILEDQATLQMWIYNDNSDPLTTGGILEYTGKAYLSPR